MNRKPGFVVAAAAIICGCAMDPAVTELPALANAVAPAPSVVASGRLTIDDVQGLRSARIRHVVDLSLDAETPDFDEAAAVAAAGLAYSNLPVGGAADLTRDNVRAFDALLRQVDKPVLVHCASGNRVGAMAALRAAWIGGAQPEAAIGIGKAWGLKGLEGEVRRLLVTER
jgi:uncharacterized protein (TIGR01244 family)